MALSSALVWLYAQDRPTFRIKVDMVVLSFTITDSKNHYINGLKPSDVKVFEDGIPQRLNTFGEGNKPPLQILENGTTRPLLASPTLAPAEPGALGALVRDAVDGVDGGGEVASDGVSV